MDSAHTDTKEKLNCITGLYAVLLTVVCPRDVTWSWDVTVNVAAVVDSVSAGQQLSVSHLTFNWLNNFRVDHVPLVEETGSALEM